MSLRVSIKEALARIKVCPICDFSLDDTTASEAYTKVCAYGCGKFTITDVGMDGSVNVIFTMAPWQRGRSIYEYIPPTREY